jgi:putative transposase
MMINKKLNLSLIMPNHLHAIVEIINPEIESDRGVDMDDQKRNPLNIVDRRGVDTDGLPYQRYPYQSNWDTKRNMPIRKPKSISSFMAGFKSTVNTKIDDFIDDNNLDIPKYNRNNMFFQRDYHDRIIRNEAEYQRIKYYIINNPNNWKGDRLNR